MYIRSMSYVNVECQILILVINLGLSMYKSDFIYIQVKTGCIFSLTSMLYKHISEGQSV